MYCEGEWYECGDYDADGHAVFSFTSGDLTFQLGGGDDGCGSAFYVTHPTDATYDGLYWTSDSWAGDGGAPHFQNGNGMHLYFLDYDGYGYW